VAGKPLRSTHEQAGCECSGLSTHCLTGFRTGDCERSRRSHGTPIKHVVVIFQENISFDHYFGTNPNTTIPDRRPFDDFLYMDKGEVGFTGPGRPPGPDELGWKDTVRAEFRMTTRIIVKFEGYTGRYVWHCHLLEHEDDEMMRPFEVVAPRKPA
jgi:hypothetical protein